MPDWAKVDEALRTIDRLDDWEKRIFQSRLRVGPFNYDIVGKLPIELVIKVFSHLDFADIFRLQRVCKKWKAHLELRESQRAILADAYGDESNSDSPTVRAKRLQNLRMGTPAATYTASVGVGYDEYVQHDQFDEYKQLHHFEFYGPFAMMWRVGDACIRIIDKITSVSRTVSTLAREGISVAFLTSELATIVSRTGICYGYDLISHEIQSVKLPSASFGAIGGRDRHVALASAGSCNVHIISCDFDTHSSRQYTITDGWAAPGDFETHKAQLLLYPATQELMICTYYGNKTCVTRYGLQTLQVLWRREVRHDQEEFLNVHSSTSVLATSTGPSILAYDGDSVLTYDERHQLFTVTKLRPNEWRKGQGALAGTCDSVVLLNGRPATFAVLEYEHVYFRTALSWPRQSSESDSTYPVEEVDFSPSGIMQLDEPRDHVEIEWTKIQGFGSTIMVVKKNSYGPVVASDPPLTYYIYFYEF